MFIIGHQELGPFWPLMGCYSQACVTVSRSFLSCLSITASGFPSFNFYLKLAANSKLTPPAFMTRERPAENDKVTHPTVFMRVLNRAGYLGTTKTTNIKFLSSGTPECFFFQSLFETSTFERILEFLSWLPFRLHPSSKVLGRPRDMSEAAVVQIGPAPLQPKVLSPMFKEISKKRPHSDLLMRAQDGSVAVNKMVIAAHSRFMKKALQSQVRGGEWGREGGEGSAGDFLRYFRLRRLLSLQNNKCPALKIAYFWARTTKTTCFL